MNQTALHTHCTVKRARRRGARFLFLRFLFSLLSVFFAVPPLLPLCVCVCVSVLFRPSVQCSLATGVPTCTPLQSEGVRCTEVTPNFDRAPHRSGDKYSACVRVCVCVVMDTHHMNHRTPKEGPTPAGGSPSNGNQTSQGSNPGTPLVIPGPSSSSAPPQPPPAGAGGTQPPLTPPVPATKIVSRNTNGTRKCQIAL